MEIIDIFPIFEDPSNRLLKENITQQKGHVFWLTGLSGSGKSTISEAVYKTLLKEERLSVWLDGDTVRNGLCRNLGFSEEDRTENIRRVAETAKIMANSGIIVLCSLVSPTAQMRKMAAEIVGHKDFSLVYVDAPLQICQDRDPKGLYKKASDQKNGNFTGIHNAYEVPKQPDLVLDSGKDSFESCFEKLHTFVQQKCQKNSSPL
jgi:adenylyl-sulfate kinase